MQKKNQIKVPMPTAADEQLIRGLLAKEAGCALTSITGFQVIKRSLDARSRYPHVLMTASVFINEPFQTRIGIEQPIRDVSRATKSVIIIGAGPAGLFAALRLLEQGIQPIILERGKDVRARRRDLAILNKNGIINPESNYCFGEGGAGTYSDGKLYTRSKKRGNIDRILNLFVHFGAEEKILYEAHPHIGTNKLPHIITAMRAQLTANGAEFIFEKKVTNLVIGAGEITGVFTSD